MVVDNPGFGRVRPKRPFQFRRTEDGLSRGPGAWEAKVRYDFLDLTNNAIALLAPSVAESGGRY
ncbi:MAG: hypothetical protein EXR99_06230 [Gemmataceae bacterium]|nr:hypothetical protein [Gemmataceae bacterium]